MKEAIFAEVRCIVLYAVRTPIPTTLSRIYLVLHFHILSFRAAPLRYPFGLLLLKVASVAALLIRRRTLSSVTSQRASARTCNGLYPRAASVQRIHSLGEDPPR